MTATTFATTSIKLTEKAIHSIKEEIAQLTEQLSQKQSQLQTELSLEQAGLSAISQFKEAVNRIAAANNPEMLQSFLQQMHQITEEAIYTQQNQPQLAEAPEPTETATKPDPTELEPPTETYPETTETESEPVEAELADEELTEITATCTAIEVADCFPAEEVDPITAAVEPLDIDGIKLPYQSLYNYAKTLGFQNPGKGRPAQLVLERFIKQEAEKSTECREDILKWIAANKRS